MTSSFTRAAALSLSFALAFPAEAQSSLSPVKVVASFRSRAIARADTIEQRAAELTARTSSWRDAAKLYRTAAELRADDIGAARSYRAAAWLYAASGDRGLARKMLAKAAERSAANGDPAQAAHSWIDAACAAAEEGRTDLVSDLLARARVLAESGAVDAHERRTILQRMPEGAVAHADSAR